ncbi:Hsp20/alpha crystallin family protein [uncultured Azohydromonas sp.]|jgi:Molecular chaperone (small heat shock protein)|uniref:Hsp20/alpha crystallin family protein n=1 Tax=uncultured Azohydromonas sp. TaxID=487342 RepID=UPI0026287C6A|nr:Hsp20/alpha crystallin family protein [uncultured Azohydromonas sp.]
MDDQQQRGPQDAQMQQQGGPSAQQGGSQQQGGQQSQFSASSGQQGGASGGTGPQQGGPGSEDTTRRGGNPYTDFFTRRGTSPMELLKRLDEDVDRLFHQFVGGGRELLRSRLRDRGGMDSTADMGSSSAAGSSGGTDGRQTEAAGGASSASTALSPMSASGWLPEVEVSERNGKLHVHVDLPGMSREDLQVHFDSDQLVLQGERRSTRTTNQPGGYYRTERTYGQFRRVIPLPEGVNPDTAQAGFHNGVLEICFDMPVRHNRTRQIPIQEGAVTPATPTASGAGLGQTGSTGGSPMGGTGVGGGPSMGGSMGSSGGGLSGGGSGRPASSAAGSEVGPQE